ncbi:hypothetical protein [Xanthomonas oryzae]|uniref:hypothetical protein n=1 Tax=Xanthomonas oryzae TaxID=347 RepID=UPI00103323A7|nr:hypothetical protein [Xanthomonas oryzae]QBH01236.1 hypothetical protein EYC56_20690 [Xanthomonas oryzae]
MSDDPTRNSFDRDALIISGIAFGFGMLLAWALLDPPAAVSASRITGSTPSKPFEWPAWVQAIGSVVAIFVAVYIPKAMEAQKAREAEAAAKRNLRKFLATALPIIRSLDRKLSTFAVQCDPQTSQDNVMNFDAMDGAYEPDANRLLEMLVVAPDLLDFTDSFADLQIYIANVRYWVDGVSDSQAGGLHNAWQRDVEFIVEGARQAATAAEGLSQRIEQLAGKHVQSMFDTPSNASTGI